MAFMQAMADQELRAEAAKARLEILPMAGEHVQKLVDDIHATPPTVVRRVMDMLK
jgi:hypothetical protein